MLNNEFRLTASATPAPPVNVPLPLHDRRSRQRPPGGPPIVFPGLAAEKLRLADPLQWFVEKPEWRPLPGVAATASLAATLAHAAHLRIHSPRPEGGA